jgi:colanic acid/amylovoran biosynthesis glycosyltransferase
VSDARPVAAIWKSTWLPASQTFVRNQVAAMSGWRPLLLGVHQVPGLPVVPDLAPFGRDLRGRVLHRARRATGYRGVYDRALRESGARVIHAHFGTSAVGVLPVARRLNLPLLVTFHGYDVTSEPRRTDRTGRRYRRRLADVFHHADTLIAVSDFVAARLVQLGAPPERIKVHHIGVPVGDVSTSLHDERSGIAFVGRLVDKKGVADLLRAVASLGPSYAGIPVRVVGDGPLLPDLRRAADTTGLQVEFMGFRPPQEVADVLRRSAVFCGPSRTAPNGDSEAFGMVFLEAALHGLPVVAYRHGGVPEAVEDGCTALLADEGDVDGLAERLRTLLDDRDRAVTMGEAGRRRVLESFDVRTQTAKLEALYDEAAHRGGPRRARRDRD